MGAQSKCSILKSTLVSSLEIVNISCTIVSSVAATSKDRARYFSWSLYAPIPNSIPSNWPLIMVIGVFSSWEAEEKKSCCARSSAFWCSISFWSWRFALCNSSKVADSFRDSVFKLFSSTPSSSERRSSSCHSSRISDISLEIRLIFNTGFVMIREYPQAVANDTRRITQNKIGNTLTNDCRSSAIWEASP